jgi:hypothetical protein
MEKKFKPSQEHQKNQTKLDATFHLIEYNNGIYNGQINNGRREGAGVFAWDSGEFFYGLLGFKKVIGRTTPSTERGSCSDRTES